MGAKIKKKSAKRKKKRTLGTKKEEYKPLEGHWGKKSKEKERLLRRFEEVPLSELRLWDDNPRINEAAVPKLAALIEEHGFVGIIVATPDGVIRRGNARYKALKSLGRDKVWVEWRNFDSIEAADEFALSDNKASEWADWDHAKLAKMFKRRVSVDMARLKRATGFRSQEIDWQGAPEVKEDDIPDFSNEEAEFVIRIQHVKASDKQQVLTKVNRALEGTEYDARAY